MDIDLTAAVVISSAVGWYAGFYFERQKARKAFQQVIGQSVQSTTALANAAISVMLRKSPGTDPDEVAEELMKEAKKYGMNCVSVPTKKPKQYIKGPGDADDNQD